jgi:Zn-dependent membrane protease YugP
MLAVQGDSINARSTFAVGVIIAATSGASVVYQIERWTLRLQSLIHFGIMLCTVLPALYLSGWFVLNGPLDYLLIFGIFLISGAVLWTVFYLIFEIIQPRIQATRLRN